MKQRSDRDVKQWFSNPFRIASIERLLPAGSYEVITDDELMEGPVNAALSVRRHQDDGACR
ncbi:MULTISPECIES: hypothetical protein [unclassified Bradyrhizobium]|uniref:hypothetical protein n=1 Tax=unclassified Bradyrhizobium TaxID=2631580 RepID=UPI001FF72F4C|nr:MULTISPECIES: hypothetical protein [unclassified Bradyrhizobium]MCK1711000.1 hypothetical protein [Bradyrhizobium sp. 143]MCK1730603.1 hypothetical protein [Bradyrhizobium sp. 142]